MHDNEYLKLGDIFTDLQKLQIATDDSYPAINYSLFVHENKIIVWVKRSIQYEQQTARVNIDSSKSSSKIAEKSTKDFKSNQMDEDIKRAKSLVTLAELREKSKQSGDTGLAYTKQRVESVFATYATSQADT